MALEEKLRHLSEGLKRKFDEQIGLPIMLEILSVNKQRIHHDGLDSSKVRIGLKSKNRGKYSKGYERFKGKIVRTVYPINLFLDGDLERAQEVATVDNDLVIWINKNIKYGSIDASELAHHHEATYNTAIFPPNQTDVSNVIADIVPKLLEQYYTECFEDAGFKKES